jgi:Cu(I)/Ag(I) efflux system protein CusF
MKFPMTIPMLCAAFLLPALAQQAPKADEHAAHHTAAAASGASASTMADGEVRKVDKAQAKITLKHGEIKALDMPPMTMVFHVKDKSLLDSLKPGDKVRFAAINESGRYTVTAIEAQR